MKCPFCDFEAKNPTSLGTHCAMVHDVGKEKLYLHVNGLEFPPTCSCGCGAVVNFVSFTKGYKKFVGNHRNEEFYAEVGKKIAAGHGRSTKVRKPMSEETKKKMSQTRIKKFEAGELHTWNDRRFNPEQKNWAKGLTKDIDPRLAEMAKKVSSSHRAKFAAGELKTWCEGLTKDTDPRLFEMGRKISSLYSSGTIKNWWCDEERRANVVKLLKESHRLTHDEVESRFLLRSSQFELLDSVAAYESNVTKFWFVCKECSHKQQMTLHAFERGMLCAGCQLFRTSKGQQEVYEFVKLIAPDVVIGDRTVIKPYELDVYVPSKKIAVEYNGVYYHSDASGEISPEYHARKQEMSAAAGVKLFQVFEDEWLKKRSIVESMIKHRLGASDVKLHARKCKVVQVESRLAKDFLERTHIEGAGGRFESAFALEYAGKIVSVMTLRAPYSKKHKGFCEIARFSNELSFSIPGGMSRLISAASSWAKKKGAKGLMTYLDQRFGSQKTYEQAGMQHMGSTNPRFWWVSLKKMERYSRQKFRAKDGLTEAEVALREDVHRIYGCRNSVFVFKF